MACGCVETVNVKLASYNTRLSQAITLGEQNGNPNLMVVTEQVETGRGKKRAAAMFLTYCPFCGTRYEPEEATP